MPWCILGQSMRFGLSHFEQLGSQLWANQFHTRFHMWHKYMAEVHNSWWFTKYFYNFNCVITYNMKGGYLYQRYYIIMHDWNTYFEPGYVFHTYNSSHCTVQRPREQWPTLTAPHPFYTQWNTTKWLVSWLAYFMIIWCILCKSPTPLIMDMSHFVC